MMEEKIPNTSSSSPDDFTDSWGMDFLVIPEGVKGLLGEFFKGLSDELSTKGVATTKIPGLSKLTPVDIIGWLGANPNMGDLLEGLEGGLAQYRLACLEPLTNTGTMDWHTDREDTALVIYWYTEGTGTLYYKDDQGEVAQPIQIKQDRIICIRGGYFPGKKPTRHMATLGPNGRTLVGILVMRNP